MSFNRVVDRGRSRTVSFKDLSSVKGKAARPGPKEPSAAPVADEAFIAGIEREAYQKGFEAGRNAGLAMADQKVDAIMMRLEASLREIASIRGKMVAEFRKDIVRLAVEIARKLTRREVMMDQEILLTLVRVAMEKVSANAPVVVYLCKEDLKFVENRLSVAADLFGDREIILKMREDLKRGDCIVESPYGSVDARISEQFSRIEQGLLGQF